MKFGRVTKTVLTRLTWFLVFLLAVLVWSLLTRTFKENGARQVVTFNNTEKKHEYLAFVTGSSG